MSQNNQDNKQMDLRKNQMQVLIESDSTMAAVNEMLSPQEVGAFKQAMMTMATNDQLKSATPQSIVTCGLEAARLSLPLSAGQGYIVVYKGKAQLDIGYKGWQIMAKRSGLDVLADPVTTVDDFSRSGYGHDVKIDFTPSNDRELHNDKWLRENILGIIVSVKEVSSGLVTTEYVEKGMIEKLAAMSPGGNSKFSPYQNWLLQMYRAKAIKYVLSKSAIDVNTSIQQAVDISNNYESYNQANQPKEPEAMDDSRFSELLLQWEDRISKGMSPSKIIASVTKKASLSQFQIDRIFNLGKSVDIAEGEIIDSQPVNQNA